MTFFLQGKSVIKTKQNYNIFAGDEERIEREMKNGSVVGFLGPTKMHILTERTQCPVLGSFIAK